MSKVDLICSWPMHLDYPLFRQWLRDNRGRFDKVIIILTNMNTNRSYNSWLKDNLSAEGYIVRDNNSIGKDEDWRDIAVKKALGYSESPWVFFAEQDLLPQEGFWDKVDEYMSLYNVFGAYQEDRLHPCCIFIKKSLLNQTSQYFGVVRDQLDHFGQFQKDLEGLGYEIGKLPKEYWEHLNGCSQNLFMLQNGELPNYAPNQFLAWCQACLEVDIPTIPEFQALLKEFINL